LTQLHEIFDFKDSSEAIGAVPMKPGIIAAWAALSGIILVKSLLNLIRGSLTMANFIGLFGGIIGLILLQLYLRRWKIRAKERYRRAIEGLAGLHSCPCCGARTIISPGTYEVCIQCEWEDDPHQRSNPNSKRGANPVSFNEAKGRWRQSG
jgi:hypothetical protein